MGIKLTTVGLISVNTVAGIAFVFDIKIISKEWQV